MDPNQFLDLISMATTRDEDLVRLGTIDVLADPPTKATVIFDGEDLATSKQYFIATSDAITASDRVLLVRVGHSWLITGKVPSTSGEIIRRRNAHGHGGGNLFWDGTTLSGTMRYIWLPVGRGDSLHFNLTDAGTGSGPFTIGGITNWDIVYLRLTDAQWNGEGLSGAQRIDFTPADVIVEPYGTYAPTINDLVIGVANGDDGLFYMEDGRVVEDTGWVEPTFLNGWTQYTGVAVWRMRYRRIGRWVLIRGLMNGGGATDNQAFGLPVGYRPSEGRQIMAASVGQSAGSFARSDVQDTAVYCFGRDTWQSINFTYITDDKFP